MTNQSTIDKLIEMRLTAMADAFVTSWIIPNAGNFHLMINSVCW